MRTLPHFRAAVVSAFAMATLALPAVADPPAPVTQTATKAMDGSHIHQMTVDKANGLEQAIAEATAIMAKGKITAVFINVTTCEPQRLPAEINAKGSMQIMGCGHFEEDGVRIRRKTPLVLPPEAEATGVKVKSPLNVHQISASVSNVLFEPHTSLEILGSTFTAKEGASSSSAPMVVKGQIPPTERGDHYLHIAGNTFDNVGVLAGETSGASAAIHENTIDLPTQPGHSSITVSPAPKADTEQIRIEDNRFIAKRGSHAFITIGRGHVEVKRNLFALDTDSPTGGGIRLVNPDATVGAPISQVEIIENQFFNNLAVSNPEGTPLTKGAVALHNNDFSNAVGVLPKMEQPGGTVSQADAIDATKNYWGKLPTAAVTANTADPLSAQPTAQWSRQLEKIAGATRFETARKIAATLYPKGTDTIVVARHDVVADSVSAVPLAEELNAPILLTQSNQLHPEVLLELKRSMPKGGKVVLMGGEEAISKAVEAAIVKEGHKVERIAGANRAATAVATAKKLKEMGKAKHILVADGTNWQPGLISGPVAAEVDGATLLSNGDKIAPETEAFLKENATVPMTAIGDVANKVGVAKEAVVGSNPTALSLAVADKFFARPKAVGVATTVDFADALAGGLHIAKQDGPLVLMPPQHTPSVTTYITQHYTITDVRLYGGGSRFSDQVIESLYR